MKRHHADAPKICHLIKMHTLTHTWWLNHHIFHAEIRNWNRVFQCAWKKIVPLFACKSYARFSVSLKNEKFIRLISMICPHRFHICITRFSIHRRQWKEVEEIFELLKRQHRRSSIPAQLNFSLLTWMHICNAITTRTSLKSFWIGFANLLTFGKKIRQPAIVMLLLFDNSKLS